MNKDNAKDYLPLVQALSDGKVIQCRNGAGRWRDIRHRVDFLMSPENYRIKCEPRVMYVLLKHDGTRWGGSFSKSEAEEWVRCLRGHDGIVRKFVEVVED